MSFILDALRKSEHERERRALPSLVERTAGRGGGSRLPLVLGGLGVLLLANVVVLAIVLLRAPAAPPVAATPVPVAPAAALPAALPAAADATPAGAPRTRPLEAEVDESAPPEADVPPPARSGPALVRARPGTPPPGAETAGVPPPPPLGQLPALSATDLPPLGLQLHVYANAPGERFIIVNGQRLHEGDTLREGAVLEQITPDGAIFSYRGTRFQLPRQ